MQGKFCLQHKVIQTKPTKNIASNILNLKTRSPNCFCFWKVFKWCHTSVASDASLGELKTTSSVACTDWLFWHEDDKRQKNNILKDQICLQILVDFFLCQCDNVICWKTKKELYFKIVSDTSKNGFSRLYWLRPI